MPNDLEFNKQIISENLYKQGIYFSNNEIASKSTLFVFRYSGKKAKENPFKIENFPKLRKIEFISVKGNFKLVNCPNVKEISLEDSEIGFLKMDPIPLSFKLKIFSFNEIPHYKLFNLTYGLIDHLEWFNLTDSFNSNSLKIYKNNDQEFIDDLNLLRRLQVHFITLIKAWQERTYLISEILIQRGLSNDLALMINKNYLSIEQEDLKELGWEYLFNFIMEVSQLEKLKKTF